MKAKSPGRRTMSLVAIVREVFARSGLQGHCFCRRVRGAYRDVWVVHHGSSTGSICVSERDGLRFVRACKRALRDAGLDPADVLLALDPEAAREHWFSLNDLGCLVRQARVMADQLPESEWRSLGNTGWVSVASTGDSIEMWDKSVERRGGLYRVTYGSYTSYQLGADYSSTVHYVGARRGAMIYAGFA